MNDGKFSGHLITEMSQIVMMDEWTPDSLSCEDAKRILQGKLLFTILWFRVLAAQKPTRTVIKQFTLDSFTGGLVFLPQKHKEASRVKYNSGVFITTNVYPDFGHPHDNEAIRKRLEVFQTVSLRVKDGSVSGE